MSSLLLKPVPHTEAARFIADKPAVSRETFDRLLPDLRARAFTITGVENADVMQSVRDAIAEIPRGGDWDKVKEDIAARISPWLDQGEGNEGRAEKRAELLLRTHGYQAYQAAQYEVMDRQRAAFPYWQYQTAEDDNVRDSHAALNGLVLPADSPFWDTHFPPWDWGCRCYIAPLSADDVAEIELRDEGKKPEERLVLDADRLRQLEQIGELNRASPGGVPQRIDLRAPEQRGGQYRFDPGSLKMGREQLQERYDPPTWQAFEKWARGQSIELRGLDGNLWEWLSAGQPRRARPVVTAVTTPPAAAAVSAADAEATALRANVEAERLKLARKAETVREAIRTAVYQSEKVIGGRHVNSAVILKNGKKVVFKSTAGEYRSIRDGIAKGAQTGREVAASIIDEEMGFGLVPPTTLLTHRGEIGSAQLFRAGYKPASMTLNPWKLQAALPARMQHDWQLFDDLVNHLDRHGGNYMFRVRAGEVSVALIDNGHTLSTIKQPKAYSPPLENSRTAIDSTNRARLENLLEREAAVRARLTPLLEPQAIDLFFERARGLLKRGTYGDI